MCRIHRLNLEETSIYRSGGCYMSGNSMLSSSLCLANVLPSPLSVCFIHTRTRSPARCNITHLRKIRRTLHPVESGGSGLRREGRTCLSERTERQWRGAHGEWGLCEAAAAAAGPLDRWLPTGCAKNKGRRARTWDTKPGHAEIIRPAQWVANKQRELLILHNVICKTHF